MINGNIPMHVLIFFCGCKTNSIHTKISYILSSMSNYIICGKTLAYLFFNISHEIYVGVPPTPELYTNIT